MPKIASILSHTNAFAPSVDSDTIRGGFLSVRATASGLAGEFDPDAALQSDGNKQDLIKEKGTVVYVTDQSDYYILDNKSNSDIAPEQASSGWITLLSAIGGQASSSVVTDAHNGITGATSSNNSGLTYIQDLTIDTNGHVTGIGTNTIAKADLDIDHLITLSGVAAAADNLGTFTGSTISNSSTIKAALQELETAVEAATGTTLAGLSDTAISTPAAGHILVYDGTNSFDNHAVSGDITLSSTGVAAIASGVIVNDDIAAGAAIATSKLASNTISGVALGGTLGALTAASGGGISVSSYTGASAVSDLQLDIDGMTDIGAAIADADLFIVDDGGGGTNRKTQASRIKSYVIDGISNADAHDGISGATSVNQSGLVFIQDITLDTYGHVTAVGTATVTKASLDIDHLITLTGVAAAADNLGSFSGTVLSSNTLTIKGALQALATQVDSNSGITGTTNLTQTTAAGSLTVNSSSGTGVTLQNASATLAGIITAEAQTIAGNKTFNNDVTIAGNLTVTGAASYVNIQEENVYIKDALITLGITDADASTIDGTAATSDVGIEAYKQGHDGSVSPTLVYDIDADYWAIDNMDHSSSALTRIARTFKTAYTILAGDVTAGYFEITHNLHHEDIIVQVRDNATDQGLVIFKYQTIDAETVRISIGGGVAADDVFNIVIVG